MTDPATPPRGPAPRALVTGASRGLGFAVAQALGARGWQVAAVARTVGGLEELDDAIRAAGGPPALLVPLDLTDDAGLARLGRALFDRWGGLDLWVHCAAEAPPLAPAAHAAGKDYDRAMAVNARALLHAIAMFAPLLKGGSALLCDDPAAGKFHAAYAASKAAARAIAESWAAEVAGLGIRVELFRPPPMPTALRARFRPGENRAGLAEPAAVAGTLLARLDAMGGG